MYILQSYDDTLQYVLDNGVLKSNRTGVDTLSVFGHQIRIKIDEYFPVITKRKVYPKSIFKELLWMISGSSNVNDLEKLGSKIWTPWKSSDFEEKNGYSEGELGPIYGWQMRHFGGDYNKGNIPGNGFDQISWLVNELKNNSSSRRLLISYWNPAEVNTSKVRLPPCHYTFQLNVVNNKLSGMLTQRSCDLPIGSPANIQFYSAFIYMLAQQTNLEPFELVYSMGDAHIYTNQIDEIKEYLERKAPSSPKLILNKADDIFSYKSKDFNLENYNPLSKIKIAVAV